MRTMQPAWQELYSLTSPKKYWLFLGCKHSVPDPNWVIRKHDVSLKYLLNHLASEEPPAHQNRQTFLNSKRTGAYRQVDADISAIQQRHSAGDDGRGISCRRDVCLCTLGLPKPGFLSMLAARAPAQSPPQETQHDCAQMRSNLKGHDKTRKEIFP